jgi:hypothetical protein
VVRRKNAPKTAVETVEARSLARRVVPRPVWGGVGLCMCVLSLAHAITFTQVGIVRHKYVHSGLQTQKDAPRVKLKPTTLRPFENKKKLYSQQTFCGLITLIPVIAPSILDFYVVVFLRCDLSRNVAVYIHDKMCMGK